MLVVSCVLFVFVFLFDLLLLAVWYVLFVVCCVLCAVWLFVVRCVCALLLAVSC